MVSIEKGRFADFRSREPLHWTQPRRFHRGWELHAGDRVIGRLAPRRWYGTALVAESPSGAWTIVERMWGPEIRRGDEPEALAIYRSLFMLHGRVTLGADEMEWHCRSWFRQNAYELLNASEFPLLRVETRHSLLKMEGTIRVEDAGRRHPQIEALVIFSWALILMSRRRT